MTNDLRTLFNQHFNNRVKGSPLLRDACFYLLMSQYFRDTDVEFTTINPSNGKPFLHKRDLRISLVVYGPTTTGKTLSYSTMREFGSCLDLSFKKMYTKRITYDNRDVLKKENILHMPSEHQLLNMALWYALDDRNLEPENPYRASVYFEQTRRENGKLPYIIQKPTRLPIIPIFTDGSLEKAHEVTSEELNTHKLPSVLQDIKKPKRPTTISYSKDCIGKHTVTKSLKPLYDHFPEQKKQHFHLMSNFISWSWEPRLTAIEAISNGHDQIQSQDREIVNKFIVDVFKGMVNWTKKQDVLCEHYCGCRRVDV